VKAHIADGDTRVFFTSERQALLFSYIQLIAEISQP
jgi:hypothetical protein